MLESRAGAVPLLVVLRRRPGSAVLTDSLGKTLMLGKTEGRRRG